MPDFSARLTSAIAHPRPRRGLAAILVLAPLVVALAAPGPGRAAEPLAGAGGGSWPWPLTGEVITPYRNGGDPYASGQHRGIDIAAPLGSEVFSVVDGRVSFSGRLPGGGEAVTVASADGQWLVSSLHLSSRALARGAAVRAGSRIGTVGGAGKRSAHAPHLHLSVRRAQTRAYVDPLTMLGPMRTAAPAPDGSQSEAQSPRIGALESGRPAQSGAVSAQNTGDVAPAQSRGTSARRLSAVRTTQQSARKGRAVETRSHVAPPPMAKPADLAQKPVASEPDRRGEATLKAERRRSASSAESSAAKSTLPLLAIAGLCLLALFLRRDPRGGPPQRSLPNDRGVDADVVELDLSRRSA